MFTTLLIIDLYPTILRKKYLYHIIASISFFSICPNDTKKIIGLMAFRNEAHILEQSLRALACYTDAIVVLDDASEDESLTIIQRIAHECHIEEIIEKKIWHRDEPGDRNKLLQAGRKLGGSHFICIDADEILTANCLKNNCLYNYILDLQPGDTLALYWIQLWRSITQYRAGSWAMEYRAKEIIFCDDGVCNYSSEFIHTNPVPKLSGSKKVLESYIYGLLHFQFVNWNNLLIKQAWYRCLERIKTPKKSVSEINNRYAYSKNERNLVLKNAPDYWFKEYSFFSKCIWETAPDWRKKQILSWFNDYGKDYFKDLDIWDIIWD
jgi:glycosyltransferase involved in cell wall biosynthesis